MKFNAVIEVPEEVLSAWKPSHEGKDSDIALAQYAVEMETFEAQLQIILVSKEQESTLSKGLRT